MLANTNAVAQSPRLCQVEENQNILAKQIDNLTATIASLEQRLDPVLRPSSPAIGAQGSAPKEMLVTVAAHFRDRSEEVISLTNRVTSILERLELP